MKVAFLTDAPYSRDVRAQRTVQALRGINAEIMVFDQGFDVEESRGMLKNAEHFSSPVPSAKAARFVWHAKNHIAPRLSLNNLNRAANNALCSFGPETIHLVNPFLGEAVLRYINEYPQCKLVYEAYEYWPEYLFNEDFGVHKALREKLNNCESELLRKSSLFLAVSKPIEEYYHEKADIYKSAVVYNVNVPDARDDNKLDEIVGIHRPIKIVFSGQFVKDRHVDRLLRALAHVDSQFSLLLLGKGPEELLYRKIIADNGLDDRVSIEPPVSPEKLIEKLTDFDIGVNFGSKSSRQQNGAAPNKVFDYLRAGLAIVSNKTEGIVSLGLDESIGYLHNDDEKAIASTLNCLLDDEQRVLGMKKNSHNKMQEFSPKGEIEKLKKLYLDLGNSRDGQGEV